MTYFVNVYFKFRISKNQCIISLGYETDILDCTLQIVTKSRAIIKQILNESSSETSGVQLHVLTHIPVNIHECRSTTFGVTCDTTLWDA